MMIPCSSASGLGGHPGTKTSTGRNSWAPLTMLYESWKSPPDMAQSPIAITYRGTAIWSYIVRSLFAIFFVIVPSITMRSDWRRDPIGRTPKRSRSCRAPLAAPNSALQQAVVMLTGQSEYMRAQLITFLIGSVSMTLWTMSLSFPTQMLRESASSSMGSSDCADFWADMIRHIVFLVLFLFIRIF